MVVHQNITNLAGYFHFLNVRKIPYVICADNMPRPAGGEKQGGQMRRLFAPQQRKIAKAARNHCGVGLPCCQAAKPCELVICWSNSRFK